MSYHIYKAKRVKGKYYVNGKEITLKDFRIGKYNDLEPHEVEAFKIYVNDYKL